MIVQKDRNKILKKISQYRPDEPKDKAWRSTPPPPPSAPHPTSEAPFPPAPEVEKQLASLMPEELLGKSIPYKGGKMEISLNGRSFTIYDAEGKVVSSMNDKDPNWWWYVDFAKKSSQNVSGDAKIKSELYGSTIVSGTYSYSVSSDGLSISWKDSKTGK